MLREKGSNCMKQHDEGNKTDFFFASAFFINISLKLSIYKSLFSVSIPVCFYISE